VIENLSAGTCTGGFKFGVVRELVVSEAVNAGMVCWESRPPCLTSVGEVLTNAFELYPNPANDLVRLKVANTTASKYRVRWILRSRAAGKLFRSIAIRYKYTQSKRRPVQRSIRNGWKSSFHAVDDSTLIDY
jgi:hypothetical protein